MTDADVEAATRAQISGFEALDRSTGGEPHEITEDVLARMHRRHRHFLEHDPDGAWVATEGDTVIGCALALKRDSLWGLSLLVVDGTTQSSGVGRSLLEASLTYAENCERAVILSTHDPRAMRLYATSDFDVYPQLDAEGEIDRSLLRTDRGRARAGSLDDAEFADTVDLVVRRARHGPDQVRMAIDHTMYVIDDVDGRGYAYIRTDGILMTLAATDPDTATDLLWRCFAHIADAERPASVYHLNHRLQWAIRAAYQARLKVTPTGPVYWRGDVPPANYLPSGAYL
jgi:GNAT superfamily N-acetyltransferase